MSKPRPRQIEAVAPTTVQGLIDVIGTNFIADHPDLIAEALSSLSLGVALFSHDRTLLYCNPRFPQMMGLPQDFPMFGKLFDDLVLMNRNRGVVNLSRKPGDSESDVFEALESRRDYISTLRLPTGEILTAHHYPLSNRGFLATYRRITKRYRAEERAALNLKLAKMERRRAEEASKHKSVFLANMSHELRTPLNAIMGFSEMIRDGVLGPESLEKYQEYAKDIHDSGAHLLSLVNDLLDIAKIEAGKMEIDESVFNLGSLMQSCVALLASRARKDGIELSCKTCDAEVHIRGDARMLKQIVLNLGSNAVKFTPEGGHVELEAVHEADGRVALEVRDNGIGMSDEEVSRVLEPFTQIDNGLDRKNEGTGLGLPLARQMVQLHGGSIVVRSKRGEGTRVTVRLPADRVVTRPKTSRYSR